MVRNLSVWESDLIAYLDKTTLVAQSMLSHPALQEPPELLHRLLDGLASTRVRIEEGTLPPPDRKISLGIARFVTDWVDDLNGPLHHAVCEIEQHYLKGAEKGGGFP
jgi:hypothetical protein